MAEPVKIDMSGYVKSGEGANGSSYDSISDPDVMVKLYNKGYDTRTIFDEHERACKVYALGIPSPEPGELVTDGDRIGIRFRRIRGKRSFARAFADEPERVPELAAEFARCYKKFHTVESPEGMFPSAKKDFLTLLDHDTLFSKDEQARIRRFIIDGVEECNTVLHGDMHFGNLLTTLPKGAPLSLPHNFYFIDLGYFAYGCPLMDIGMTYNICLLADENFLKHDFHFGKETGAIAWEHFRNEYFFGPDRLAERWFGPSATKDAVDDGLKPYALLKLLLVEYNVGFMPENYVDFCHETVKQLL